MNMGLCETQIDSRKVFEQYLNLKTFQVLSLWFKVQLVQRAKDKNVAIALAAAVYFFSSRYKIY